MKLFFVGRRAAGRTRAAAQRHLAHVHGRMVVRPPADAGPMPAGYTQHHVLDGAYPATPGPHAVERDLVTEFLFDDPDHLRASTQTGYYRDNLAPDEPRFVDRASVEKLRVNTRLARNGARGRFKLFLLLTRQPGTDWGGAIEPSFALLGDAGFGSMQLSDTMESPMGAPFVDAVIEAWHSDRRAVLSFADRWTGLPVAAWVDHDRSLALATEVFTTQRLRDLDTETAADR